MKSRLWCIFYWDISQFLAFDKESVSRPFLIGSRSKAVATASGNPPCRVAWPWTIGSILQKLGCPFFTHPILALINNRRSHGGGVWVSSNSNMKPGVIPSCHFPFKRHFFPIGNPHYPLPPSWDPLAVTDRQRMKKPLSLLKYSHWYRSQSKSWHLDSTTPGNASPRAVLNARNTGMPGHLLRKACFLLSSFLLILFSLLLVKNNVFFLILKVYIHCRKNQKVKINNICKHF